MKNHIEKPYPIYVIIYIKKTMVSDRPEFKTLAPFYQLPQYNGLSTFVCSQAAVVKFQISTTHFYLLYVITYNIVLIML